jgi:hypothetical protein
LDETHGFTAAGVADPVNCTVAPIQIGVFPVIVGSGFTVTTAVVWHPPAFVYVIVVVPAEIPVTKPVPETVATPGFELVQGVAGSGTPVPDNCTVAPIQIGALPEIEGFGLTVTTSVV